MNDLKDHGRAGDGDGKQWNYPLLVPMLALAAFRWVWTRDSRKEMDDVRSKCEEQVSARKSELEAKYGETLTEQRRMVAHLELQLEKEHQRVQSFRDAMTTQNQRLAQDRQHLMQERKLLEEDKRRVVTSGAAGSVLHDALQKQNTWFLRASATIRELESQLVERQSVFCSHLQSRQHREQMEKNMLLKAVREPIGREVDLQADLEDIFRRDRHCAEYLNVDKRKNGSLMWVYLKYWQLQVMLQMHKRAEEALLTGKIK